MIKKVFIIGLLSTLLLISACGIKDIDKESFCLNAGGEWLSEHNECEGITAQECEAMGGTFDDCASDCRHDPDAEFCTMQCIQVCYL